MVSVVGRRRRRRAALRGTPPCRGLPRRGPNLGDSRAHLTPHRSLLRRRGTRAEVAIVEPLAGRRFCRLPAFVGRLGGTATPLLTTLQLAHKLFEDVLQILVLRRHSLSSSRAVEAVVQSGSVVGVDNGVQIHCRPWLFFLLGLLLFLQPHLVQHSKLFVEDLLA